MKKMWMSSMPSPSRSTGIEVEPGTGVPSMKVFRPALASFKNVPPGMIIIQRRFQTERPCADGQFGNLMKLYRDWRLSGDLEWLRELWPYARRSIEYAWSPDNPDRWDPERTGVLWGRRSW